MSKQIINNAAFRARWLVLSALLMLPALSSGIDIRVSSPLGSSEQESTYTVAVDDCGSLAAIQAGVAGSLQSFAGSERVSNILCN